MLSLVVAPLFYLLPIGVGSLLLFTWCRSAQITFLFPFSFLLGAVAITRVFECAEQALVLDRYYWIILIVVFMAALAGLTLFLITHHNFVLAVPAIGLAALIAVPAFLHNYFIISTFPFTDIFQDVHPMKDAEELARTHVLSGLGGSAYIPVKPVLNGLLISLFGYNQTVGIWALAPWTATFRLAVAWQAAGLVGRDGHKLLAFVLVAGSLFAFDVTNGVLCAFGSVLLLVTLINFGRSIDRLNGSLNAAVLTACLATGSFIFWKLLSPLSLPSIIVLLIVAVVASLFGAQLGRYRLAAIRLSIPIKSTFLVFLLIGCILPLHRGSMLFVPIAAVASIAWVLRGKSWVLVASRVIEIAAPVVIAAFYVLAMSEHFGFISIPHSVNSSVLSWAAQLSNSTGEELQLGQGTKNAMIEWAQAIGPLFAFAIASVFLFAFVTYSGRALWQDPLFAIPWALALGLTCFVLTGFPFFYRAMFFVSIFFSIALSVALPRLWTYLGGPNYLMAAVPLGMAVFYTAAMFGISALRPYAHFYLALLAFWLVIAVVAAWALSRAAVSRPMILMAAMAATISVDRLSERGLLYRHSYGTPLESISAISHYSPAELAAAAALADVAATTIVVSDPLTTSIIRARTGLNAPFPYSNLDTLYEHSESNLRRTLAAAADGNQADYCKGVGGLLAFASNYNYLRDRLGQSRMDRDGSDIFDAHAELG